MLRRSQRQKMTCQFGNRKSWQRRFFTDHNRIICCYCCNLAKVQKWRSAATIWGENHAALCKMTMKGMANVIRYIKHELQRCCHLFDDRVVCYSYIRLLLSELPGVKSTTRSCNKKWSKVPYCKEDEILMMMETPKAAPEQPWWCAN